MNIDVTSRKTSGTLVEKGGATLDASVFWLTWKDGVTFYNQCKIEWGRGS